MYTARAWIFYRRGKRALRYDSGQALRRGSGQIPSAAVLQESFIRERLRQLESSFLAIVPRLREFRWNRRRSSLAR
jgi:hypothetical protein